MSVNVNLLAEAGISVLAGSAFSGAGIDVIPESAAWPTSEDWLRLLSGANLTKGAHSPVAAATRSAQAGNPAVAARMLHLLSGANLVDGARRNGAYTVQAGQPIAAAGMLRLLSGANLANDS